jgi:hypothetical protein
MSTESRTSELFDEARSESASRIYKCAMRCEATGYDVLHVDKQPDTGVLLEAHGARNDRLSDDVVIQIAGEIVSVVTPLRAIETSSVEDACELLLWDLMRDDIGDPEDGQ